MRRNIAPTERNLGVSMHEIFDCAFATRRLLEEAWSDETAFQGIELTPGDVASRGQCGVSSLWICRQLSEQGLDAMYVEGGMPVNSWADEHVWAEVIVGGRPIIIDLASDQYSNPLGSRVHVGEYSDETFGRYEPSERFDPNNIPRKKLLARYAILESNISNLPRRKRRIPLLA